MALTVPLIDGPLGLTIDQAEADTLHRLAAACPDTELTVTLAR
ncbi:hypothetical protein [Kitasatospora griseola]|nr:hypothetical protein [Kitasatospora griseola]GGR00807.1 hypothetical protein GCM10010195_65790 [Kitasatospora griseola]